jgi:protein O-GlcNAc transferase
MSPPATPRHGAFTRFFACLPAESWFDSPHTTFLSMNARQINARLEEALALHKSLQHDEAERLYAEVRKKAPKNFDAWFLSGAMAFQRGDHLDQAIHLLTRARKLQPLSVECRLFLGMALADADRCAEAEPHLSWVLKRIPPQAEALENLAKCQRALGRPRDAADSLRAMVAASPDNARAHSLLGELVAALDGFPSAEPHFRAALAIDPSLVTAQTNLGLSLIEQKGRIAEGMAAFDQALAIDPMFTQANTARALGLLRLYKPAEALEIYQSTLWLEPSNARIQSARNMTLQYLDDQSPESVADAHREFADLFTEPPAVFFNTPEPDRKLRLGLVSPDFRAHSVFWFIAPILRHLDRERFDIILYHTHHLEDDKSRELAGLATIWRSLSGLDDDAAAALIRSDAPDILLDLAGHSAFNRLPLFAKKPAPVQMTYLGYPNTTGLPAITHRLVDETTDPAPAADALATERLVRFSPCAWTFEPPAEAPTPAMPPADAPITFGSLNNFLKATPSVLATWARLLEALPAARLLVKTPFVDDPEVEQNVRERLAAAGIPAERTTLLGFLDSRADHLATWSQVDVALDTFPYNGTTTTCEALWMGVPVVSLAGTTHASRVGLSLLTATGHADWVAENPDAYIAKALALAGDRALRGNLRSSLRQSTAASILCDHANQTRRFEHALTDAWREWCASQTT